MAFATIHYYSHALGKASSLNVVFPDAPDAHVQVTVVPTATCALIGEKKSSLTPTAFV